MSTASKTLAIKARVYNQIRTDLYKKHREENAYQRYKKEEVLTDKEKIELFNRWFLLNKSAHEELNAYKAKRKYKAKIQKERDARGHKAKVKTTKEQYKELQLQLAHAI